MPKISDMEKYWNNINTLNKEEKKEFSKIMKDEFENEQNRRINSRM